MAVIEDLGRRSCIDPLTGCIRWTGAVTTNGYGLMVLHGKKVATHRVAYELAFGPIPQGLELDHVHERGCRYRDCLNPDHLEAVTHAENVKRARALRTHCKAGHELTGDNVVMRKGRAGVRYRGCRACKHLRDQESARRVRERGADRG